MSFGPFQQCTRALCCPDVGYRLAQMFLGLKRTLQGMKVMEQRWALVMAYLLSILYQKIITILALR